ncbi:MAG: ROK family protein [Nitrospiraceae bacterium]
MTVAQRQSHRRSRDRSGAVPSALPKPMRTLAIDVGGTKIKAVVLNELGELVTERLRFKTPVPAKPNAVLDAITGLAENFPEFDRISIGVPAVVTKGMTRDAPNLGPGWQDFNLGRTLAARLGKPVRAANDADIQGFGAISGSGVELVLTLGTGVGSALFVDGTLVPNLEFGSDKLSKKQLKQVGKARWNRRLLKAVMKLEGMFHYDRLYIGGGNARFVDIGTLPPKVTIVSNLNGLAGGIALWRKASPARSSVA